MNASVIPNHGDVRALPMERMQSSVITETYGRCAWKEFPGPKLNLFEGSVKALRRVETGAVDRAQVSSEKKILWFSVGGG